MNNKIIASISWKFFERIGTQGIQFIISIVLARLLLPEEYGLIGLITIFIAIANVFVQSGFNMALIQKKEVKDIDYSSAFFISLIISLLMYCILFLLAPYIAIFYKNDILKSMIRVLALTLPFGAINSIQIAKISREFAFKKLFKSSMGAALLSGCVGIILAMNDFGAWALVFQQILNQMFIAFIMFFTVDWKPSLRFSLKSIKELFSFGKNILVSSLIDTIYNNMYGLIIGKIYDAESLGYYNRADQFPKIIVANINGSIQSVMLPSLSMYQDNRKILKQMMRKSIRISCYIIFPIMMGLMACSTELILIILTDKWKECIIYVQILCFNYMFWPIHTTNLQAINAVGRSDIFLRLEIIKKIIGIIGLCVGIPFGLKNMLLIQVFISIISIFINAFPNKKLFNYIIKEQISDILPSLFIAICMTTTVLFLNFFSLNIYFMLILKIAVGVGIYILLSYILKNDSFLYLCSMIKKMLSVRNKTK